MGGDLVDLGDVAAELGAHGGHDAQNVVGAAARGLTCVQCGAVAGVGTPSSRAASIIHFASPDSLATGGMDLSVGSDLKAMASRSSSQDCTTEPSLQELITAAGSSTRSDFTMVAKLRRRLHHAVFDAVVHHFGEVAAAHRAGQHQSGIAFRLKCLENRTRALEVPLLPPTISA